MRDLSCYGGPNFDNDEWQKGRHWVRRILKDENPYRENGDAGNGCFEIRINGKKPFHVIASNGDGWEHVSASCQYLTPTWDEMCVVKALFFTPKEWVIQFHPSESEYVNNHPYCLHLWRPISVEFPTPPSILTGVKSIGDNHERNESKT